MYSLYSRPVNFRSLPKYQHVVKREETYDFGVSLSRRQLIQKRILDITLASIALLLALPMMIIVGIAIMLDSPGGAIFAQKRVGLGGKTFTIYKFRSMVANAESLQDKVNQVDENGNTIYKVRNDFRVTRMGEIIRKTSLDELPQLINVIKGDMSLVGPRPEVAKNLHEYATWQHKRFTVPQGITGWWQIHDRSDAPLHLNTEQDLYYVEHYSLWMDIKIILMTIPAILKQKGAF